MLGIITDIQRFSVHDGPGIRTTVFFKGCQLHCAWCHNPETIRPRPELDWYPQRCIGCRACEGVCPQEISPVPALSGDRPDLPHDRCTGCGACARVCCADARVRVGREMSVDGVRSEVMEDVPFYKESGGGVTLSGGEPLLQLDFAVELLTSCRAAGLQTALETNLCWPAARLECVLPLVDLVMADVKHPDAARHREATGSDNGPVLANLRRIAAAGIPLIVRTPVIPGFNDAPATIEAIARSLGGLTSLRYYELLPYHPLGESKRQALGLAGSAPPSQALSRESLQPLAAVAAATGLSVRVAGRIFETGVA